VFFLLISDIIRKYFVLFISYQPAKGGLMDTKKSEFRPVSAEEIYQILYPERIGEYFNLEPLAGNTLHEVRLRPIHSGIMPFAVDLSLAIGPVNIKLPLFSAAMDAVSGAEMLIALNEMGGCGIAYRAKYREQMDILARALAKKPFLVDNPKCLRPTQILEDAKDILTTYGFSTIPVVRDDGTLDGVLFTRDVAFKGHLDDPVEKWMMSIDKLKYEKVQTSFDRIKDRLLNEQECNVLPLVDDQFRFQGIYFMKDFFHANPNWHQSRPLVGLAIGVLPEDLDRARTALELGAGVVVIDSSHGNSPAVIGQTASVKKIVGREMAVIVGNVADVDGYLRLAVAGADGVKCGIGSGSICTTSLVTGAGFPRFTLIRELLCARQELVRRGQNAPVIIPDGGINGPGEMAVALAAGGSAIMAGKWLAGASESLSAVQYGTHDGLVRYWGMASRQAIKKRLSDRYGRQKIAPEGVEGWVEYRGPLRKWIGEDIELVQGGLAHIGAENIICAHEIGIKNPHIFCRFTAVGERQNNIRVKE